MLIRKEIQDEVGVTRSSGNVFKDLGLENHEELLTKAKTLYEMMGGDKQKPFTICVSGPRPQNLGIQNPFSDEVFSALTFLAINCLTKTKKKYPNLVVRSGMALGWDQAVATACVCLKIPFVAVIPGDWQKNKWSNEQKNRYEGLLGVAQSVENLKLSADNYNYALAKRNSELLIGSDAAIVLNVGSTGTADTIKKLEKTGIKFWDVNREWEVIKINRSLA